MDRGVVDGNAALGHHLLQVPEAQIVSQIPPDLPLKISSTLS
jgi:hypothetical protein